jgi:hypothetical protein
MKQLILFLIIGVALFTAACKLDKPDLSKGGSAASTAESYQPINKGTSWTFKQTTTDNLSHVEVATQTTTITGDTKTFNNKLYYVGLSTSDTLSGNAYYSYNNGDYRYRTAILGTDIIIEYLYLKDNATIGQIWTAPVTDNGTVNTIPAQIIGDVEEKGISKTVSGKEFANVIHTKILFQYNVTGAFETYQVIDFYVAKGVGIIEMDTNVSQPYISHSTLALTDYTIK